MKKIEIIAPAGNWEMLSAAIKAGADAVYLGIKGMNMRASAANFSLKELKKVVKYAHENKVNVYLTVNTIIFEKELKKTEKIIAGAKKAGVDAIIAWDLAVLRMAKNQKIPVHISTQASLSNSLAINELKRYNPKKIVLARECTIEEIKQIVNKTKIPIEVFAHGAMCVAESGRCFMSQFQYNKSANRGECLQPCRRKYLIKDVETGDELSIEENYVLSPKDLCTIPILDELIKSGIKALKIEGRARTPEYVYTVVKVYKEALELTVRGELTLNKKKELIKKLKEVYHRDFSNGFYMGRPIQDFWNEYGVKSEYKKEFIGTILNYYKKPKAAYGKLNASNLKIGDLLLVIGPTTGVVEIKVESLRNEKGEETKMINKGETFTCNSKEILRKNDKIYKKIKRET